MEHKLQILIVRKVIFEFTTNKKVLATITRKVVQPREQPLTQPIGRTKVIYNGDSTRCKQSDLSHSDEILATRSSRKSERSDARRDAATPEGRAVDYSGLNPTTDRQTTAGVAAVVLSCRITSSGCLTLAGGTINVRDLG